MTRRHRTLGSFSFALLLGLIAACAQNQTAPDPSAANTMLIRGAAVLDGGDTKAAVADVRFRGDEIVAVGNLQPTRNDTIVEAAGLYLAPGFIDTHSHADSELFDLPDALSAVSQGITTVIVGQDGVSPFPLRDFISRFDANHAGVNVASYVGHNTLRSEVLGNDFRREADSDEIARMALLLNRELMSGAFGLSTGLEYDPGIYSATSEIIELANVAAAANGRYVSHLRSEDRWLEDALDELIEIGRVTDMPVHISHLKLAMKRLWGQAPMVIRKLNAARADGIRISADIYPYEFWQSDMMVLLPDRDVSDRAAIDLALAEMAPPEGMWLTKFAPQPEYVGKTLVEVAKIRGVDTTTAFAELATESQRFAKLSGEDADAIIATSMRDADIRELIVWPHANVCTDGALNDLHPRARGSFPRVLKRYVRESSLLSLESAIYKMTGLSADNMGITDRGRIRPGAKADLVLFDFDNVADRATAENPERLSEGIIRVWTNGQLVFYSGKTTGARPGRFLLRQSD